MVKLFDIMPKFITVIVLLIGFFLTLFLNPNYPVHTTSINLLFDTNKNIIARVFIPNNIAHPYLVVILEEIMNPLPSH